MRIKSSLAAWLAGAVSAIGLAGTAAATPRESFNFTAVDSNGLQGGATNSLRSFVATGTFDPGTGPVAYGAQRVNISGRYHINTATASFPREAAILISPPTGTPIVVQAMLAGSSTIELSEDVVTGFFAVPVDAITTAGTWNLRFFETFDDATTTVDGTWDTITFALDDAAPPAAPGAAPTAVGSGTFTNVPSDLLTATSTETRTYTHPGAETITHIAITGRIEALRGRAASSSTMMVVDARVGLTPPGGTEIVLSPAGTAPMTSPSDVIFFAPLTTPVTGTGNWVMRFFEGTDEAGGVDSIWTSVTLSLLTAAPPQPPNTTAEVEPNETKATATAATLAPGAGIWGTSTGTATTAGLTSLDTFKIKTTPAALGVYRYRMQVNSIGVPAHTITIRGWNQATGVIGTTDTAVQTSLTTSAPARFIQWYGFGLEEEVFVRVTGGTTTVMPYTSFLERVPITPIDATGTPLSPGSITISRATGNTSSIDMWVYNADTMAVVGDFGNEGNNALTRTFAPGNYLLAVSLVNTANNLAQPADSSGRSSPVLDNPNAIACSSTTTAANLGMHFAGSLAFDVPASKVGPFDIVWIRFTVAPPANPTGGGSATPNPVEQGRNTVINVQVVPVGPPNPSTGIAVRADLSAFGGSATQLLTDMGGNLFQFTLAVPAAQALAGYPINFTVSDAQGRSSNGSFTLTVVGHSWDETLDGGGDAGQTLATAQRAAGSGALSAISGTTSSTDTVDLYRINLCSPANFSASTVGGATYDTQLFLFRLDGTGIASNDDEVGGTTLQSRITNAFTGSLPVGDYLLGISQFNVDPQDSANANIFGAPVARSEIGPATATALDHWAGTGNTGGAYRIALTGACLSTPPVVACNVADIVSIGGLPPPDGLLTGDDFNAFIAAFAANDPLADIVSIGGLPPPDGLITGDDFNAFIAAFAAGCP